MQKAPSTFSLFLYAFGLKKDRQKSVKCNDKTKAGKAHKKKEQKRPVEMQGI